ncbi:sigma-70 family RNA polymerase sigma factor [Longispora sp. NPDC051575]|uniref:sigma-70 family RNA polymerase sigma factor n=1 Tax=Longispora sp. NPDC051575 TaxID=3154943 RepID=UPI0034195C7D
MSTRLFPTGQTSELLLAERAGLPEGDPRRATLRARVIEKNLPMAHQLARRYSGRGEPGDDLAQVAALALVRAVDGYDPDREVPFLGYAVPCVLGALKRHFRDSCWDIRVPRSVQELSRHVLTATSDLGHRLGRQPTPGELAAHLLVDVPTVAAALGATHSYRLASLDVPPGDAHGDLSEVLGEVDPRFAGVDDRLALGPLVEALPARERRILRMRYSREMSQSSIAAEIGISQMQVSRLLRRSLDQLRSGIAA